MEAEKKHAIKPAAKSSLGSVVPKAMSVAGTGNVQSDAEKKRKLQALEMQRERILSERTSSPHRRSALSAALLAVEEELTELGWVVHL